MLCGGTWQWLWTIQVCVEHDLPANLCCFVLTDFVDKNVDSYRTRPQLKALALRGIVDFALLDATTRFHDHDHPHLHPHSHSYPHTLPHSHPHPHPIPILIPTLTFILILIAIPNSIPISVSLYSSVVHSDSIGTLSLQSGHALQTLNVLIALISNYVFDSLPHDLYMTTPDSTQRLMVQCITRRHVPTHNSSEDQRHIVGLDQVQLRVEYRKCASDDMPELLREHTRDFALTLDTNVAQVLYPVGAIEAIQSFITTLAQTRPFLILITDKSSPAASTMARMDPIDALALARHGTAIPIPFSSILTFTAIASNTYAINCLFLLSGSISMPLNFEILQALAQKTGATVNFCNSTRSHALRVAAFGWVWHPAPVFFSIPIPIPIPILSPSNLCAALPGISESNGSPAVQ